MDRTVIKERIARLREELRREHLGAFIFSTSDPHNSEYTAEYWKDLALRIRDMGADSICIKDMAG